MKILCDNLDMSLKKVLFAGLIISAIFYATWLFGYIDQSSKESLDRQTYSIMAGIKLLTVIALYIAWRVTPEKKD